MALNSRTRAPLLAVARDWIAIEHRVDENARRDDLVLGALLPELQGFLRIAAHVADGGDSARHPYFQLVVDWLRNPASFFLNVSMRVD
jgi:hypothetical protein